jgi:hypothetical protein
VKVFGERDLFCVKKAEGQKRRGFSYTAASTDFPQSYPHDLGVIGPLMLLGQKMNNSVYRRRD